MREIKRAWKSRKRRFLLCAGLVCFHIFIFQNIVRGSKEEVNRWSILPIQASAATPSNMTESGLAVRSVEDIQAYGLAHPFNMAADDIWSTNPNIDYEMIGVLSADARNNGLNALNFMRYVAGLNEVTYNTDTETYAQAGTTLLVKVGALTHTPQKPSGVSDEFYRLAYRGTSRSNIGMGYKNIAQALVKGWMNDGDAGNIEEVGHRRWCLDPRMRSVSFGHSGRFTSMYVMGEDRASVDDVRYVPWPAQKMPVQYFSGPWSVSLNRNYYQIGETPVVTLTEINSGSRHVVRITDKDKAGRYMNISRAGYGSGECLIFKPGINFAAGDTIRVNIEGIKDAAGNDTQIEYEVEFFSLPGVEDMNTGSGSTERTRDSKKSGKSGGGSSVTGRKAAQTNRNGNINVSKNLPSYVVKGSWNIDNGNWKFSEFPGSFYTGRWAAVYNPYANIAAGQSEFDWFYFNENAVMHTGWLKDKDGAWYYLNPVSDGSKGKMLTGWHWIQTRSGEKKCYYFNTVSDGHLGKMLSNTTIDGYQINAEGEWEENGKVQTR